MNGKSQCGIAQKLGNMMDFGGISGRYMPSDRTFVQGVYASSTKIMPYSNRYDGSWPRTILFGFRHTIPVLKVYPRTQWCERKGKRNVYEENTMKKKGRLGCPCSPSPPHRLSPGHGWPNCPICQDRVTGMASGWIKGRHFRLIC